jgi:hypothetical protein
MDEIKGEATPPLQGTTKGLKPMTTQIKEQPMYQVYVILNNGEKMNVGKPQKTKALAHDFCKTVWAIMDTSKFTAVEFDEVQSK